MENRKHDNARRARIKRTAEITGYSESMVEKVLADKRTNDNVFAVYMELLEGENALVEAVKKLVPFPTLKGSNK